MPQPGHRRPVLACENLPLLLLLRSNCLCARRFRGGTARRFQYEAASVSVAAFRKGSVSNELFTGRENVSCGGEERETLLTRLSTAVCRTPTNLRGASCRAEYPYFAKTHDGGKR